MGRMRRLCPGSIFSFLNSLILAIALFYFPLSRNCGLAASACGALHVGWHTMLCGTSCRVALVWHSMLCGTRVALGCFSACVAVHVVWNSCGSWLLLRLCGTPCCVALVCRAVRLCCVYRVPFHPVLMQKTPKKRIFQHGPKTGRFLAFHFSLNFLL